MPWKEYLPMSQKIRFISDYIANYYDFSELCFRYNISRKTGYKWINRFNEDHNPNALLDRTRKPHHSPSKTQDFIIDEILKLRSKHPSWGPKKLLNRIGKFHPEWNLPANSTTARILNQNGMIKPKRRSTKRFHPGRPMTVALQPNDTWTTDFKGQFKTQDGIYCYPLTVVDLYSRYILACDAKLSTRSYPVKTVFTRLFEQYGLPKRIRSDNGCPFASRAIGRISKLSVWWMKLGIIPELIEPGCPQQNGAHERMHKTLKYETTIPPAQNRRKQQIRFDKFIDEFNYKRPHEAIDMKTPSELFELSPRKMPDKTPKVEYPDHFEVRLVSNNSGIKWKKQWVYVSRRLVKEYIGLEEVDYGIWNVYFKSLWLGRLHENIMRIVDENGNSQRTKRPIKT